MNDMEHTSTPKVSIIIPCYNGQEYLHECMDSIVNQTLKEIEIICINDGSKDKTLSIFKEYEAKDNRIKIIDKPNSGYGHSMNVGLDTASGEYIGILESDDMAPPDMYEVMYQKAKELDLDMIKADFYRFVKERGELVLTHMPLSEKKEYYNHLVNPSTTPMLLKLRLNTWAGIYKRDFLNIYGIRHNETPGASYQDNGFWFQTFCLASRAYFLDKPYYLNRRDNPNSSFYDKKKVYCMNDEYRFIRKFLEKDQQLKERFISMYTLRKYHNYIFTYRRIDEKYRREYLKVISEEFRLARENGELDPSLFSKESLKEITMIADDPEKYYFDELLQAEISKHAQQMTSTTKNSVNKPESKKYPVYSSGEKPEISIILPTYNAEKEICRCLDSVLSQTFESLEVICIDDGSTDGTLDIIKDYALKDHRIKVFSQSNQGVAAARNHGLSKVTGKYIAFVDADDYVEKKYCSRIWETAEEYQADITACGGQCHPDVKWARAKLATRNTVCHNPFNALFYETGSRPFLWNKLYKASLIKDAGSTFNIDFRFGSDQAFLFLLFPHAKTMVYIKDKLYHYTCNRENSIMTTFAFNEQTRLDGHMRLVEYVCEKWTMAGWSQEYGANLISWCIKFVCEEVLKCPFNERVEYASRLISAIDAVKGEKSDKIFSDDRKHIARLQSAVETNTDKPEVSVIIPVYNSEKYLKECLYTITRQTFQNIEIICVDDGSTDGSLEIIKEFQSSDNRIKILCQENQYAGVARNNGMAHAKGRYLLFLDSDDFFYFSLIEKAHAKIEQDKADICLFSFVNYVESKQKTEKVAYALKTQYLPKQTPFSCEDIPDKLFNIAPNCPWNKLFRKDFVTEQKLTFQNSRTSNDVLFVDLAFAKAKRITYVNEPLVKYRVGLENNLQSVKVDSPLDYYNALLEVKAELIRMGIFESLKQSFVNMALGNSIHHLDTLKSGDAFVSLYTRLKWEGFEKLGIENHTDNPEYFYIRSHYDRYLEMKDISAADYLMKKLDWNRRLAQKMQLQTVGLKSNKSDEKKWIQLNKKLDWNRNKVKELKKLQEAALQEVTDIRSSWTYKIGRFFTYVPRKIREILRKVVA